MKNNLVLLGVLVWLLSACQTVSNPQQTSAEAQLYTETLRALPKPAALPPYEALYQSYLQHPAISTSTQQWQLFEQQAATMDVAECQKLPWQQQLSQNFWSLSFYRLAINCFNHHAETAQLKLFSAYQNYHVQGILSTGNGKSSYSAYRINSFADAHEVLRHLGMETQDYFSDLSANGNSLLYVVQVYDSNDNKFKTVYFQNQPYLYALEQYPYPFIGLSNGWNRVLLPEFAKSNPVLGLPLAQQAVQEKRYADATLIYQNAIADDSLQARVELAEMCFLAKTSLKEQDCYHELIEAADRDYVPALELLLYLHHQGRVAKSSDKLKTDLLQTINQMSGNGQAEMALSRQYFNQTFGLRDVKKASEWLAKAIKAGQPQAEFFQIVWQLDQKTISDAQATQQFKQLAAKGSSEAAYRSASLIMQEDNPSAADIKLAHTLLLQAKQAFHPEADYLLAVGYEAKIFPMPTGTDQRYIVQLYQAAANKFLPRAMQRIGELYLDGELVKRDAEKANNWFLLCARLNSVSCAFNAAVMFDNGDGIPASYVDAFNLFSFAAERGHPAAMNRLALMYIYGRGATADVNKGLKLLESAANLGSENSRLFLGVLYLEGEFVGQNLALAKSHFTKVKDHPKAAEYLKNWDFYLKKFQKNP